MASSVTIANILASGGAPSSGNNVTASWTPDTTKQYLLAITSYVSTGSTSPVISSVTGNGLTWTLIDTIQPDSAGADRSTLHLYAARGVGGSVGTITIAWSTAPTRASWVLDEVANANAGLGVGTLPQADATGTSSASNPSATLGSSLKSGNVTYAAAAFESSTGTLSAGSGYTALGTVTTQSLAWLITEWDSAGSTSASASNTTTTNRHGIILIEISCAGAADVTLKKMSVAGSGTATSSGDFGTADVTLKKMSIAVSGNVIDSGTAAGTLKKMSVTSTATALLVGTAAATLKKMSVAVSGNVIDSATAAGTFGKMAVSASGSVYDKGTSAAVLKKMMVAGTATAPIAGTGVPVLKKMTTFGQGKAKVSGTIVVSLNKMSVSGTGLAPIFGTVDVVLPKMQIRAGLQKDSPLFVFSQF